MKNNSDNKKFEIVKAGYNKIAERYIKEREKFDNWKEIKLFCSKLQPGAKILDVGCGTGLPIAKYLSDNGYLIHGIDFSEKMIEVASRHVPAGTFEQMNMVEIDFPDGSFDGIVSCYAIIHVPREHHGEIFKSLYKILTPQGVMLISVASWAWEEVADYLEVDMFWSHYDPATSESLLKEAGFDIEFGQDIESGGEKHYWILARKPE